MITINLLPWYEQQNSQQRVALLLTFGCILAAVIFMTLAYVVWLLYQENSLTQQIHLNQVQFKRAQASRFNEQSNHQQEELIYKKQVLASLVRAASFKVCISALQFTANKVIFQGQASSSATLIAFLQNAALTSLFAEVQVVRLQELVTGAISFECHGIQNKVAT